MSEQEKKRQRIYDKFPKWLKFLYGLHQAQTLTSLITGVIYGAF